MGKEKRGGGEPIIESETVSPTIAKALHGNAEDSPAEESITETPLAEDTKGAVKKEGTNILIAYFTWAENTFSITTQDAYSSDYDTYLNRAIEEHDNGVHLPFCSHGTGGFAASLWDIGNELPDDCIVLEEFGAYRPEVANSQDELITWLSRLDIEY